MTPHHVCLFDIDGTLLNTGGAGLAAMEAALEQAFGVRLDGQSVPTAGRTDRAIVVDMLRRFDLPTDDAALSKFTRAYFRQLEKTLSQRRGLVLPGVPELLQRLHQLPHVSVGLLTGNFREGARLKLQHYGLADYFPFGGFGDRHLDRDDVAREAWAEVQRRFGDAVTVERVWVVGDTPADIQCARAIGARAVAVGTGILPNELVRAAGPDVFLDDLTDVEGFAALLSEP